MQQTWQIGRTKQVDQVVQAGWMLFNLSLMLCCPQGGEYNTRQQIWPANGAASGTAHQSRLCRNCQETSILMAIIMHGSSSVGRPTKYPMAKAQCNLNRHLKLSHTRPLLHVFVATATCQLNQLHPLQKDKAVVFATVKRFLCAHADVEAMKRTFAFGFSRKQASSDSPGPGAYYPPVTTHLSKHVHTGSFSFGTGKRPPMHTVAF